MAPVTRRSTRNSSLRKSIAIDEDKLDGRKGNLTTTLEGLPPKFIIARDLLQRKIAYSTTLTQAKHSSIGQKLSKHVLDSNFNEFFEDVISSNTGSKTPKSKPMDGMDMVLAYIEPPAVPEREEPVKKNEKSNLKIRQPVFPLPPISSNTTTNSVSEKPMTDEHKLKSIPPVKTRQFKKKQKQAISKIFNNKLPETSGLKKELVNQLRWASSYKTPDVNDVGSKPCVSEGAFASISESTGTRPKYLTTRSMTPLGAMRKPKRGERVYMLSSETGSPLANLLEARSLPTVLMPQDDGTSIALCTKTEFNSLDERSQQNLETLKKQLTSFLKQLPETKK